MALITALSLNCSNQKPTSDTNTRDFEILNAELENYFPGAGIGRGKHFSITIKNVLNDVIVFDSLQNKTHCVPFDGKGLVVQPEDSLVLNAYILEVDKDNFPEAANIKTNGDTTLNNKVRIFYHTNKAAKNIIVESITKKEPKFYE